MSTKGLFATNSGAFPSILEAAAIALAVYATFAGALWAVGLGLVPTAAALAAGGWPGLVLALCWIGFAVGRHGPLQSGAILGLILVACAGMLGVLLGRAQSDEDCPCARDHPFG